MVDTLMDPFGIGDKAMQPGTPQQSVTGYNALPAELQQYFKDIAAQGSDIAGNASQYFAPMGLTEMEQLAATMMMPENFGMGVSQYLNPFSDIITQDINRAFEDQFSALNQRATEAGAFGSSGYREGQSDLERARLDAITAGLAGQYNTAANQFQTGISNLLGFGGLERGIDLAQRQAVPSAVGYYSDLINPLLGVSTQTGAIENPWSIGNLAQIAGGVGGAMAAFSDERLKENIKFHDIVDGFKRYVFNYIGDSVKCIGGMAQDIIKIKPEAVIMMPNGYYAVDYAKLPFRMERV